MKAKPKLCMLMLAAMIWGFAFTAQTVGADDLGPLTFNAVRFTLGGLVLIPFSRVLGSRLPKAPSNPAFYAAQCCASPFFCSSLPCR